ncbi:MAG: ester cyclase [Anaerolineaceae bacterium]|nr:ester cyclase [Anaerolineaceae bacterium]
MTTNLESIIRNAVAFFNNGDLEKYLELYAEDAALHYLPPQLPGGAAGARLFYGMFMAAFPDIYIDVQDILVDGDRTAVRIILTGTHQGELMGIPASGKPVSVSAISILRFAGSKCVERWSELDMMGLMTQIGAVPA